MNDSSTSNQSGCCCGHDSDDGLRGPMSRRSFGRVAAGSVAGVAAGSILGLAPGLTSPASAQTVRPITLPVPAEAVAEPNPSVYWSDTWGAPRSGGRSHEGVDMMGPKMTPLLAVADGHISWMRYNSGGALLTIQDDEGWKYHYVHINNDTPGTDDGAAAVEHVFGPGIETGARVTAGQLVAYMGDSGNAEWTGSHLHFEIENPAGQAINPTPSVDAAKATAVSFGALSEAEQAFVRSVYTALRGHEPSESEARQLVAAVKSGGLAGALEPFVNPDSRAASIDRLYHAVFNRLPDDGGFTYWVNRRATDLDLARISDFFADSPEYRQRFAGKGFEDLLDQIYLEMFNRPPDEPGKAYWLERLENDPQVTPGTVLSFFTESNEAKSVAETRSEMVSLHCFFYGGTMPTAASIAEWKSARRSLSFTDALEAWFLTDGEIAGQFASLLD